ncbi:FMN-binding split barrel [Niveomyces insectorum RCEF 264]|uniref:FMN-binding split barrel n=1 Tax=Niveomyces insectorum RCEF 264 TaxID=1081102 RepID=A0A167Y580_9HYPO|nr:FMN-binding split barrel [Niveomyces insectorum RCEF 264]
MHLRTDHVERNLPVLRQLIKDNPLGLLTTAISCEGFPLLQSSHVPFVLDVDDETSTTELGRLRAHMAKANSQSQAMLASVKAADGSASGSTATATAAPGVRRLAQDVLVIFTSPVQHYVTPKFYIETKPTTAKVVPTWNYAAAQVYGRATIYYYENGAVPGAPQAAAVDAYLDTQLNDLSSLSESYIMGYTGTDERPLPWKVADAPEKYLAIMKRNIIGIEVAIDRLEGKFKMSQELREGDRAGVVQGFRALDTEVGQNMADLVQQRAPGLRTT